MTRPGTDLTGLLADPTFYSRDPHPLFTRLRAEAPIAWCDEPGFWAVSRHADVYTASTDNETFCSSRGILLQDIGAELSDIPGALLYIDPPDHTRYRQLVRPAFSPSRMRAMEDQVRHRARALIDRIRAGTETDIVHELTVPYPIGVIADLLDIPDTDWERFYRWSDAFIAAADGGTSQSEEVEEQTTEATLYLIEHITRKKADPGDDLVSYLVTVEADGEVLNQDELLMFLIQLLVAGNETTRNLITGGLVALADNPSEWQAIVRDSSLIPCAVEEALRWTCPVISFVRTATRDTELGGMDIAEGEPVLLLYWSANFDVDEFGPTADRFDVRREPNHHMSFGFGAHFCLGAMLARIEARVLLEELTARFTTIERVGDVERIPSTVIAGIRRAPMVLG